MSCCRRKAPFDCRYKGCRCAVCGMDFASFDKADPIVVTLEGIDSGRRLRFITVSNNPFTKKGTSNSCCATVVQKYNKNALE